MSGIFKKAYSRRKITIPNLNDMLYLDGNQIDTNIKVNDIFISSIVSVNFEVNQISQNYSQISDDGCIENAVYDIVTQDRILMK